MSRGQARSLLYTPSQIALAYGAYPAAQVAAFQAQTDWSIDFAAGNDSADGTSAHPIKTLTEWARRNGVNHPAGRAINVAQTVKWTGTPAASDNPVGLIGLGPSGTVAFVGQYTSGAGQAFTARTACAPATNVPDSVTDGNQASGTYWSNFTTNTSNGKRVRTTVAGAQMWVMKDLTAKAGRMSPPIKPSIAAGAFGQALLTLGATDAYVIDTLPQVPAWGLTFRAEYPASGGVTPVSFQDLWFTGEGTIDAIGSNSDFGYVLGFYGCDMGNVRGGISTNALYVGSRMTNPGFSGACVRQVMACAFNGASGTFMTLNAASAYTMFDLRCIAQGLTMQILTACPYVGSMQFYDATAPGAIDINPGAAMWLNSFFSPHAELFGNGNSGHGVTIRTGASMLHPAVGSNVWTLTGTTNDVRLFATSKTWAQAATTTVDTATFTAIGLGN